LSKVLLESIANIPVKSDKGIVVYVRDVANVHDGFAPQQNIVRTEGKRSTLLTILKNGNASTLDIVNSVKELLPGIQAAAPPGLKIGLLFDQSIFVQRAIESVLHEGVIAAFLTGAMILLFLGSWRSTFIVLISIPLSILTSLAILSALGYSINVMTLGGLALAIGILVDDATVEIENIHRNMAMGKPLQQAILDGAQQVAIPAFVATLSICIVFIPVVLLEGPAKFLFVPFALAVVFAVLTSYVLSRTVVPVLVKYLLKSETHLPENAVPVSFFGHIQHGFNRGFDAVRARYVAALDWSLHHRPTIIALFVVLLASAFAVMPFVGRDFFPTVDAGQIRLHVVAKSGLRIEETEKVFSAVEEEIRRTIPAKDLSLMLDNIGTPSEAFNIAFGDSATVGVSDGEILISLTPARTKGAPAYTKILRKALHEKFPDLTIYFQPADIISQILNFGLQSPINIRVAGYDRVNNLKVARELRDRISKVPGAVDVHIHQQVDAPELHLEADRTLLAKNGLTQQDLANDLLISLSSSTQVTPNYWVDPNLGVPYFVAVQTPEFKIDSIDSLMSTPVASLTNAEPQLLSNLATLERREAPTVINHFNIQPVFDIYANAQGRDLGGVITDINKIVAEYQQKMSPGNRIFVRGLVVNMDSAFLRLGIGFIVAILLAYMLMVVNYQSLVDPLIIISALPGAFAGIIWSLFLWRTTFNVPSLMGAMMSVGVATANSILIVTFANQQMLAGKKSISAALAAGSIRLRPVIMTALAMVVGMLPMALGLGEGGEQNAPLGRAVIGGLSVATLFFVPVVFSLLRREVNPILAEDTIVEPDACTIDMEPLIGTPARR
jgi:multidrug efflux pump subunit AcrB